MNYIEYLYDVFNAYRSGHIGNYDVATVRGVLSDCLKMEEMEIVHFALYCCELIGADDIAYSFVKEAFDETTGNAERIIVGMGTMPWLIDEYPDLAKSVVFYCYHSNPEVVSRSVEAIDLCILSKNMHFPGLFVLLVNMLSNGMRDIADSAFTALQSMGRLDDVPLAIMTELSHKKPSEFTYCAIAAEYRDRHDGT